ncbi:MAG: hypothetical protein WDZ64_01970 [Parcubacteria group bacterium]
MRRYINNLKERPPHHRKRFALLFSTTVTLFIFGIWTMVNFGTGGILATKADTRETTVEQNEVSPLASFYKNIATSFQAVGSGIGELKNGFKSFNPDNVEEQMRDNVLTPDGR